MNTQEKIIIRDAMPEEYEEIGRIIGKAYKQYENNFPNPDIWQLYMNDSMNVQSRIKESQLLVAETDGKLAGTVTLYPKAARSAREGWPKGWAGIRLLGVDPAYRGRGIGQALIEECIRRCRLAGANAIGLHTAEMMDVARRMYEKRGFQRVPQYDFHPTPKNVVMAYKMDIK